MSESRTSGPARSAADPAAMTPGLALVRGGGNLPRSWAGFAALVIFVLALASPPVWGQVTSNSVRLRWTATGDDSLTGRASQYDLRYSTSPIAAANFAAATPFAAIMAPSISGAKDSATVTGLLPSTTYWFALKVADEVPNWSAMSNIATATTLAAPAAPDTIRPAPPTDVTPADTTATPPPPPPPPTTCWTGGVGWQSFPASVSQTGVYATELDASPSLSPMDASFGFAATAATAIQQVAAIIWFRPTGFVEVRNGGAYGLSGFRYVAGQRYHFRLVVDVPGHHYSVYVRLGSGAEQALALNYAFRSEQAAITSINYLVLASGFSGTYQVCGWTR